MAGASKPNAKMIKLRRRIRGISRKDVAVADAFRSSVAQAGSTDAVEDKLWNDFRGHTSRAQHVWRCLSTNRTDVAEATARHVFQTWWRVSPTMRALAVPTQRRLPH